VPEGVKSIRSASSRNSETIQHRIGSLAVHDLGARVFVYVGNRRISGEVQTGSSFLSQNDPRIHIGLADEPTYDHIEVQWPGGQRESFPGGKANQILTLTQGKGSVVKTQPAAGNQ
jgi:hypothetical protein